MRIRGNGNRTKEIELMELGLSCSKSLKRSCEIELISYFLQQELELIRYGNWNSKQDLELIRYGNWN